MRKFNSLFAILVIIGLVTFTSCKKKTESTEDPQTENPDGTVTPPDINANTEVRGFDLLDKICGIWNGPITSSTSLGNFSEAPMDFRPISGSQISVMNELDPDNSVFMSFFIAYTGNRYEVVFRNGGTFAGMIRTSYMKLDSLSETASQSYYRFVDFIKGDRRTITEVTFKGDSLRIKAYTNKTNTLPSAVVHMDYRAKKQYSEAHIASKNMFGFPKKEMVKNLANAFDGFEESVFYATYQDPYPRSEQPYLGTANLSYTVAQNVTLSPSAKVTLMVSTEPLISATGPITANFKTRSRYIILSQPTSSHALDQFHPGTYYYYALVDNNSNGIIDSGDLVSTANTSFTIGDKETISKSTQINFQVP
ncbi:MAG TPA: hypothetical protein VKZ44_00705 [Taishania sp.]|nr:hypothetical protein [Taishania sp.]